jgi:hypothetical protein
LTQSVDGMGLIPFRDKFREQLKGRHDVRYDMILI